MDAKDNAKRRKTVDKPLCKYGLSCYQKNPEHRKKFKHPTEKKIKVASLNDTPLKKHSKKSPKVVKLPTHRLNVTEDTHLDLSDEASTSKNDDTKLSITENAPFDVSDEPSSSKDDDIDSMTFCLEETVDEILKSMPKDFFDFWEFCASINKSNPESAFSEYGYHLVGVFDLLAKKLPKDVKIDISCHWRYYFDPPEFQTVLKKDGHDQYHIGYFRDDPSKKPSILASNSAAKGSKLTLMGDNIFSAMNIELSKVIALLDSKVLKDEATKLKKDLQIFASAKNYELNVKTDKTERRQKKVVAKTFNGLGIVVPVKNDIGYRTLPVDSNDGLRRLLKRIISTEDMSKQLKERIELDEILSNVNFANDELDYGMGLELGIDLFCHGNSYFHDDILRVLPLAYDLLNRPKYAAIIQAHLKDRRKGQKLSTLNI